MPDWISGTANVNVRGERSVSVKMQYAGGYAYSVQLGNGLLGNQDYTVNEVSSFRESLGAVSNFGVRSETDSRSRVVAPQFVQAFDDAYGPNVTANLRFINNSGEVFTLTVPGPRKGIFGGDGVTLITPDDTTPGTPAEWLFNLVRDTENLVNNSSLPANSFTYNGGERARRAMKPSTRPDVIQLVEPTTDPVQP